MRKRNFVAALVNRKRSASPLQHTHTRTPVIAEQSQVPNGVNSINQSSAGHKNAALSLAIEEYCNTLPEADRNAFLNAANSFTPETLLEKIRNCDSAHKQRSKFRSHSNSISKFLSLLERFMSGISTAIQANPDPSAIVVGAVRLALTSALQIATFFDRLTEMADRFNDFLGPLATCAQSSKSSNLLQQELVNVYKDLLKFWRAAYHVFVDDNGKTRSHVLWRSFLRVQWEPFEMMFSDIEKAFVHHLAALSLRTDVLHLHALHRAEEARKTAEREAFLQWISTDDFEKFHEEVYRKRHPGTGEWLIQTKEFQNWIANTNSSLLWCYGKAGAGKSVLLSNVLEHVTERHGACRKIGISFVYYDFKNPDLNDPSTIVSSLIKQLCRKKDDIPPSLLRCKNDAFRPTFEILKAEFVSISRTFDETYLILDALDECVLEKREHMIEFLTATIKLLPHMKIFVTSRRESDITEAFMQERVPIIQIQAENTMDDIRSYISSEVKKLRNGYSGKRLYIASDTLEQEIIEVLSNKSEGMFLWVQLQLESLSRVSKSRNDNDIRKALTKTPRGLTGTYLRIAQQIDEQPYNLQKIAITSLQWVLYAKVVLTEWELIDALASAGLLDLDKTIISPPWTRATKSPYLQLIFDVCANLIESRHGHIYPVHYSVQEVFADQSSSPFNSLSIRLVSEAQEAHRMLAETCLRYLNHDVIEEVQRPAKIFPLLVDKIRQHPLIWYASRFFDHHIQSLTKIQPCLKEQVARLLGKPDGELGGLLQIRLLSRRHSSYEDFREINGKVGACTILCCTDLNGISELAYLFATITPPKNQLHLACSFGLNAVVDRLIATGCELNDLDESRTTPIYQGSFYGHQYIVSKLLAAGANSNKPCGKYGNALQAACYKGHVSVVKILLLQDIGLKSQHILPLANSSEDDIDALYNMQKRKGVDVNLQGGEYGTALQAGCISGDIDLVRFLLDRGADVNLQGGEFGTALQAASVMGNTGVVNILLDAGADVNLQGGEYGTALIAACSWGCPETVKILLEAGANVNSWSRSKGSALHAARKSETIAKERGEEVIDILIPAGAEDYEPIPMRA